MHACIRLRCIRFFLQLMNCLTSCCRFPGAGQAGTLGDLNAEKSYSAWPVHMQTVAGNEALVHYLNARGQSAEGEGARPVEAFG